MTFEPNQQDAEINDSEDVFSQDLEGCEVDDSEDSARQQKKPVDKRGVKNSQNMGQIFNNQMKMSNSAYNSK
jgi:hypothetical protein